MNETCSFETCDRPAGSRSRLCRTLNQQRYHGKELKPIRPSHYETLASAVLLNCQQGEGCWIWSGRIHPTGYAFVRFQGEQIRAHHASYRAFVGDIPDGLLIDHKCRNKACVNPDHLHLVTKKQNAENVGISAANTSGVRGVTWCRQTRKWAVKVTHNGRGIWGGRHASLADAEKAAVRIRERVFTNSLSDDPNWSKTDPPRRDPNIIRSVN